MFSIYINKLSIFAFIIAAMLMPATQAPASDTVRVLIVHAYSQEYPWTKGQHEGFVERLKQGLTQQPKIKTEYLDTKRIHYDEDYADRFADYLKRIYRDFNPDVLYVTDDNGLSFGIDELSALFPDTPLFFAGVNDYSIQSKLDKSRVTGVFEKKEIGANLDLLNALFGDVM